jgi:D-glycero-alpha-D-manno-heptose-7-phosphate kinase
LNSYLGKYLSKSELARAACDVEIKKLKEPIGKQDQYASAFGGLNFIEFHKNGEVTVTPLLHGPDSIEWYNSSLIMIRTKILYRSASLELRKQRRLSLESDSIINSLCELRDLAISSKNEIEKDPTRIGNLLVESWNLKVRSNPAIASSEILDLIELGMKNGAIGSKLLGAGGAGFVLFVVPPERKSSFMHKMHPLISHPVKLDFTGSSVIYDQP